MLRWIREWRYQRAIKRVQDAMPEVVEELRQRGIPAHVIDDPEHGLSIYIEERRRQPR